PNRLVKPGGPPCARRMAIRAAIASLTARLDCSASMRVSLCVARIAARSAANRPPINSSNARLSSSENPAAGRRATDVRGIIVFETLTEKSEWACTKLLAPNPCHRHDTTRRPHRTARGALRQARHVHVSIWTSVLAIHRRAFDDDEPGRHDADRAPRPV